MSLQMSMKLKCDGTVSVRRVRSIDDDPDAPDHAIVPCPSVDDVVAVFHPEAVTTPTRSNPLLLALAIRSVSLPSGWRYVTDGGRDRLLCPRCATVDLAERTIIHLEKTDR